MKEYLLQMDNERGTYLPFVLLITLILFSTITTMIAIYKNEKLISNQLWEFMKAETIVEMTKRTFVHEHVSELDEEGYISYSFPSGDVFVTYNKVDDDIYSLFLKIETDYDETIFIKTLVII